MRRLGRGTTLVVSVALGYVALSLAHGGYPEQLIAGAAVVIWWAIAIAIAARRWPLVEAGPTAIVAGGLLASFAAWTALSLAWASDDGSAFVEVVRVLAYLGLFLLVVLASRRGSLRSWLAGLAVGLVVVACIALMSRFEPSFGGDRELIELLPGALGRLNYPIGYWNGLAACMAVALVLLVWFGAHAGNRVARVAASAFLPVVILAIHLTSSRGGVAAAAVGVGVLLGVGPARARLLSCLLLGSAGGAILIWVANQQQEFLDGLGNSQAAHQGDQLLLLTVLIVIGVAFFRTLADRRLSQLKLPRRMSIVTAAVAIAAVVVLLAADPSGRYEGFKTPTGGGDREGYVASHLTSGTGSGRYQYWGASLDAFEEEPVKGIGAGAYEAWWTRNGSLPRTIRDAHSLYLETMAELGLVGLLLIVGFLGTAVVAAFKKRAAGLLTADIGAALAVLGAGATSAALDWTWELPACFGIAVVAVALLTGPAAEGTGGGDESGQRFGVALAGLTVIFALAAIWAGGTLFLTHEKLDDSSDALESEDLAAAAQHAEDASTLEPWAADPHLQLALVAEAGGDLGSAEREIDEAIDRAPDDWQLWFVKTRLEVKLGKLETAQAAFRRIRELNPHAPFVRR